jgi:hypothetical protein
MSRAMSGGNVTSVGVLMAAHENEEASQEEIR